jgi:hypothetical protein
LGGVPGSVVAGRPPLRDAPIVWYEDDRRGIPQPKEREPSLQREYFEAGWGQPRERTTDPVRITWAIGRLFGGDKVPPADNVNALDEAPNSTWFTNRIALFPMTPEQAARGPGHGKGPDRSRKWVVVSAKTQGVTPGFNIRDAKGDTYLIKFDPPGALGQTTAAGVITNRVLHAAGYNVPDDAVVTFQRDDLVLGEDVKIKLKDGSKRPMTDDDIDEVLAEVDQIAEGEWLAISSKFLTGAPLGPFNYRGRRKDDPNDKIKHENRRELRGFYVLAAWLNHFDVKQQNSLDMFVTEDGSSFVRHYLIDFASTLGAGAGATGPNARSGYEYTFDFKAIMGRTFTLGLRQTRWRKRTLDSGYSEVAYLDDVVFHAGKFRPNLPNDAFSNTTSRDGYWGAKIAGAFTDAHLRAIVAEANYREPGAADYVTRMLGQLRDELVVYFFDRVPPLDFFAVADGAIHFQDLGENYDAYPGTTPRYRVRCASVNADRKADRASKSSWIDLEGTTVPLTSGSAADALSGSSASQYPFLSVELQVDRGDGWSPSVTAHMARASGRIVAVDR